MSILIKEVVIIIKNDYLCDKEYTEIKKPKNKKMSTSKMENKYQGMVAVALIIFFILVAIAVTTPTLSNTTSQPQDQQEITIENETGSDNMTIIDDNNNNTE